MKRKIVNLSPIKKLKLYRHFASKNVLRLFLLFIIIIFIAEFLWFYWEEFSISGEQREILEIIGNILAKPELTEESEKLAPDSAGQCRIPPVELWPAGVQYEQWNPQTCGEQDPFRVHKGRVYFDDRKYSCIAQAYCMVFLI